MSAMGRVRVPDSGLGGSLGSVVDLETDPLYRGGTGRSAGLTITVADRAEGSDIVRDLIASHELDRRRIALDLHDVVGQALTAVRLNLEHVLRNPGPSRTDHEIRRSITIVDQAIRDVRDLAFDIRPAILDDLGLIAAARWHSARQARLGGYRHVFRSDRLIADVGVEVEAACFRTLQEALTNVARHAHATRVQVELQQTGGELTLLVDDDGVGFDPRQIRKRYRRHPTLGLIGAAERVSLVGGTLEVTSRPGDGTRFRARFPLRRPTNAAEQRP